MNKPISVVYEETKTAVADILNNSKLPPFIIQNILKDFLTEVTILAKQQYEQDLKQYNESLTESGE